ncbi:MAG: Cof-type HAD-IIB family hydrolase [Oscillospiraceae bacterium]|jgi:Cof subfamily protein (haloacid dehalogenase superfamily)|nr:Cof-type HAD-IIB family hydrolase [Oscillospiraceae bacterium]
MHADAKLIVTDLDGTLLRSDKTLSSYTEEVLRCCRARGIKIIFATARPANRMALLGIAENADRVIISNGASIYQHGESVTQFGIAPAVSKPLMNQLLHELPGLRISIEYGHIAYANCDLSDLWETESRIGFDDLPDAPADKIVIRAGAETYAAVQELLPAGLYAQLCEGRLILIMQESATKWNAVRLLAEGWSIKTGEIVAFGDDHNDMEMLKNCGVGVAVVNALDEVKAAADCVCDNNDEDGVAKWLESFL